MVVHESFVTRKPLEFTLLVLFILFLLLLPVYYFTRNDQETSSKEYLVTETYPETMFNFGPESELTEDDKKILFKTLYEGNFVQWTGTILDCSPMNGLYRVSIDQTGGGFGDVLFTTEDNCTSIMPGTTVTYKVRLIDLKVRSFTGKDGEILTWG